MIIESPVDVARRPVPRLPTGSLDNDWRGDRNGHKRCRFADCFYRGRIGPAPEK
jgi:hypothetical protein